LTSSAGTVINDCVIAFPGLVRASLSRYWAIATSKDKGKGNASACHALNDKVVRHVDAVRRAQVKKVVYVGEIRNGLKGKSWSGLRMPGIKRTININIGTAMNSVPKPTEHFRQVPGCGDRQACPRDLSDPTLVLSVPHVRPQPLGTSANGVLGYITTCELH
jgi:hypothetical protein